MIVGPGPDSAPTGWLAAFLLCVIGQRIAELVLSARNTRRLRARGAREYGAGHFPFLILVHVLFPLGLILEVLLLGARPPAWWPVWLALWALAQGLRYAAVKALGERWNVRIWVLPGVPPIQAGPYAWLRHPNYVAVVVELLAATMLFGAWRTAIVVSLLNFAVLRVRIRAEERALAIASARNS